MGCNAVVRFTQSLRRWGATQKLIGERLGRGMPHWNTPQKWIWSEIYGDAEQQYNVTKLEPGSMPLSR